MDDLKTILDTLSDDEKKEFTSFIQRQKKKKDRKDIALLQLLLKKRKYKTEQLVARLYPQAENTVAYYALRKRLMHQLTEFIMLKRMEEDITAASSIMGILSLSRYLFDARLDRLAWSYLRKAEKLAKVNEQYDLLNSIYNLQIEKADNEFADHLDLIIRKRNANKIKADEDERANIANSIINQRLQAVRQQGSDMHFDNIIQEVLKSYNLSEAVSKRPSLLYKLMSIARSAILARKDFNSFEPYIISQYHEAEQKHGFLKAHQYYKLGLLYMIAHVLYRNKKFMESVRYLNLLYEGIQGDGKNHYAVFFPRYTFLKVANLVFMGRNHESTILMENLLYNSGLTLSTKDSLTARFGLGFSYFTQGAYSKANQILMDLRRSDKWCEAKMGREWVLKKSLGEMLIQYELGNEDLALNKLRSIERYFSELLQQPAYKNVKQYLQAIRYVIEHPEAIYTMDIMKQLGSRLEFSSFRNTDIQAMSFYAWLKSKTERRPYYHVLLELANSNW